MIQKIVPAFEWLRNYRRRDLSGDLSAGVTVAVMLVPQGMAYAMLAGLPPVMGLYASAFPLIIYALFGSSRHLSVGPVAMVSLLVFAGVSTVAEAGSDRYIQFVLLLSLMAGVVQLAMGFLRLGSFVNFFSHTVISGFSSAAAIIIFVSQLHHLMGIELKAKHSVLHILFEAGRRAAETDLVTLLVGLLTISALTLFKKEAPKLPSFLLVVAGGTAVVYALRLDQLGVKIVGEVPRGLPGFSLFSIELESLKALVPVSLTLIFVGFMESISVAKFVAAKERYQIDANRELKGLGLANIVASLSGGYPVTGGFSRTAVNYEAGARTGAASMISAGLILLILLFLTPLFHYLPHAVLAGIVMVSVAGLVDLKEARYLFKIKPLDGWTFLLTFAATLVIGTERGILAGLIFSLLVFIRRSSHPHTAELGYVEKERVFRNVKRFPEAVTYPAVLILRVDASLYFANMAFLDDLLHRRILDRPDVKRVIMDLSGVNDIDAVGIERLEEIMNGYREKGIEFLLAAMKGPVRDLVARAGWDEKYGEKIRHPSIQHAVQSLRV